MLLMATVIGHSEPLVESRRSRLPGLGDQVIVEPDDIGAVDIDRH
jgi:hypothetical protein